jgi:hypothetical protein
MAEIWSVPTWIFFHSLAEKINEDFLKTHTPQVIHIIKQICFNLPCPHCREHATAYCNNLIVEKIKNKDDLIQFLYIFHNNVNARLKKPIYDKKILKKYKRVRLDVVFSTFLYGFMKKYSRTLYAGNLSQDGKRRNAGRYINTWTRTHWKTLQGFPA